MTDRTVLFRKLAPILTFLLFLVCYQERLMADDNGAADTQGSQSAGAVHVKHILGFEGAPNNANGDLSIQDGCLRFLKANGSSAKVPVGAIQDLSMGEQDRQVGGVPMTLVKSATPYGGGRLISLFAHKKFETVTLEYVDSNGGLHGAIFQLEKGKAQDLTSKLESSGVHIARFECSGAKGNHQETRNEAK